MLVDVNVVNGNIPVSDNLTKIEKSLHNIFCPRRVGPVSVDVERSLAVAVCTLTKTELVGDIDTHGAN